MKTDLQNKVLLSVAVTTYNHKKYISQCLDGILMQQTTFPFEIILGEDESNDGTREICMEYANTHPDKIRLFLRSRKDVIYINGQATGRYNFMENLKACKGKYIALCEGDDYWTDPLKLQKQVDFLEENPEFSLSFHNVNLLNSKNDINTSTIMHSNLEKEEFITEDIIKQWFIPTASIVFRNYDDFKLPDWFIYCSSGDIPLLLLLSLKGKLKYINEILGCYRLHNSGISNMHHGYFKVFSMIYIYQNFNIYTNFKFQEKINEAMVYEVRKHLPEIKELNKVKSQLQLFKSNKSIKKRIKNILKRLFIYK